MASSSPKRMKVSGREQVSRVPREPAGAGPRPVGKDEGATKLYFGPWYRKSPYFEAARRYGCYAYDIYNKMYIPGNYAESVNEYWNLVNHVTLWDVGCERQVEITGPDAFDFTNYLTPRDLSKCEVGQGKYVIITAEDGGIVNDPVLMRLGKNHFWLSLADSDVLLWAKGVALHAHMDVNITEPDVSPLQLQGPKSKDVARALFGPKILDLAYYYFMEAKLDGIPLIVSRTGWSAEVGYEIYLRDGSRGDELWERVMEAGKPFNIRPTGPSEARRIEAGILNYPSDMTLENNPYEVSLGWLVDGGKEADYIGKAALKRIKEEGVKRKLVGVEVDGELGHVWLPEHWPVEVRGRRVGKLTALAFSPRLKKNIGYAMVPIEYAAPGTRLTVKAPSNDLAATVVPKPFIDPNKDIPKSQVL